MGKIAVIYWSGTGNTEAMANSIARGIEQGGKTAELFEVSSFDGSKLNDYDAFAFGCPSMGDEVLEESEFEPFFEGVEGLLRGKKIGLFGSYGWGDGQWMRDWQDRVSGAGGILFDDGLIINGAPDAQGDAWCADFGKRLAGA